MTELQSLGRAGMEMSWGYVVPESVILGKDGYEWTVHDVDVPEPDKPRGSVKVTMSRPGREPVTGYPPAGSQVRVLSMPKIDEKAAVMTLREKLGAVVVDCGWCDGDPSSECVCDVNCGKAGCVNF